MEKEIIDEKRFVKGFNAGYLLSKHEPELLKQILKTPNASDYIQGLKLGMKQHDREKLLDQLKTSTKDRRQEREQ